MAAIAAAHRKMTTVKRSFLLWLPPAILLFAFVLNLGIGSVEIPLEETLKSLLGRETSNPAWGEIIWNFRLTKALTCILAGGGLAISGLLMQTFFRNPLAGPDVLGLSSGAGLAVSLLILGDQWLSPYLSGAWALVLAASLGCALVFLLILVLANRVQDSASLLIIGLMVGAAASSLISVVQYSSQADALQMFLIWSFGTVGTLNWVELQVLTAILVAGVFLSFLSIKSLNAWVLGDRYLHSLGIHTRRARLLIVISASLLTGGVTAFCGPIAFVGLAVPHLTKLLIPTSDHRILIPLTVVTGAATLLICDMLCQLPGDDQVLPLNAVTALLGSPVVIWIILRGKLIRT